MGHKLKGGEALEFSGDLGSGKTTFIKSLVAGAGSKDEVSSPSFTINNEYMAPKFAIEHFDFYRISNDPGLIKECLSEFLDSSNYVILIEWADSVRDVLPSNTIQIKIVLVPDFEDSRVIQIHYQDSMSYLFHDE